MALWCVCLTTALGVVYSTHKARQSTQTLEALRKEASELKIMSGKYMLEKSSWSAYSRVEAIATEDLNMVLPEHNNTVLVYKK